MSTFDNSTNLVTIDGVVCKKCWVSDNKDMFVFSLKHDTWWVNVRVKGEASIISSSYEQLQPEQSVRVSGKLMRVPFKDHALMIDANSITIKEEPKEEHFDEETMKAFLKEVRMG